MKSLSLILVLGMLASCGKDKGGAPATAAAPQPTPSTAPVQPPVQQELQGNSEKKLYDCQITTSVPDAQPVTKNVVYSYKKKGGFWPFSKPKLIISRRYLNTNGTMSQSRYETKITLDYGTQVDEGDFTLVQGNSQNTEAIRVEVADEGQSYDLSLPNNNPDQLDHDSVRVQTVCQ